MYPFFLAVSPLLSRSNSPYFLNRLINVARIALFVRDEHFTSFSNKLFEVIPISRIMSDYGTHDAVQGASLAKR